ncbi:MAG: citrate lyase acyl carrier protein [Clostridia bacterium]|nr:citrate lyase acyl carrier protein [Clostridia bacterium]
MKVLKKATAGTMESSDAYIEIEPCDDVEIELSSVVKAQFGDSIIETVKSVLSECGVTGARVKISDRGALDCVLRARVETACLRGKEQ